MKYLFLILVGYELMNSVKCEDVGNNYFVVEMPEDVPPEKDLKDFKKPFQVYWNVPTMQCASKKIPFQNLYEKFGIIQNDNDRFIGEKITILYEPGDFPAIFKNESSGKYRLRNGGVPQEGNLEKHLIAFKNELNLTIPDPGFNGIGIIDFESWRPVFRQNFGILVPYKDVSIEIEKQLHWWWPRTMIQAEASRRFEAAARGFMQTTLSIAKQMRPKALWGYYGFPHCFNMASNNMKETCAKNVPEENNGIYWLWSESTALFPSIYSSVSLSATQLSSLINGRVRESVRERVGNTPVLPYFWFRYRDSGFMSQGDLAVALNTLYKSKASGFIIWGSSNDVNTVEKCNKLYKYVENVLGPNIAKYTKQINKINDEIDNEINDTITTIEPSTIQVLLNETIENTTSYIRKGQIDPEFDWIPPKNYSEDISQQVDEELAKKGFDKSFNNKYKSLNQIDIMDLIFNALINSKSNMGSKNVRETKDNNDNESIGFTEIDLKTSDLTVTGDPNLIESSIETSTFYDKTTINDNFNNEEISTTEYSTTSNEYTEKSMKILNTTEKSTTESSATFDEFTNYDQSTQTNVQITELFETYQTTENYKNGIYDNKTSIKESITSIEERSDYLIISYKQNNDDLNESDYIENEKIDSDYLVIIKNRNNEETTEFYKNDDKIEELFTSQTRNEGNVDFIETTENLDQVNGSTSQLDQNTSFLQSSLFLPTLVFIKFIHLFYF